MMMQIMSFLKFARGNYFIIIVNTTLVCFKLFLNYKNFMNWEYLCLIDLQIDNIMK